MSSRISTPSRTRPATRCTPGFAQAHQLFQNYDYPIFLAEVASTFNEELLTHHLLEKTTDPRMRAYLINRQIDDIRGTVYRQTMFAEFEKIIHEMEEAGEALTLDTFRGAYRGLLEAYFGPDFTLDSELEIECLRIPHFYSAFYVYKYATGMSAAVSLSQSVLHGGQRGGGTLPRLPEIRRLQISPPHPPGRRRGHDHPGAHRAHPAVSSPSASRNWKGCLAEG